MKAIDSRPIATLAARTLKLVGLILILAFILDMIILLIPPGLPDKASALETIRYQINVVSQAVDRGVIPLVGLGFLFTGLWIDTEANSSRSGLWQGVGLASAIFASLMGLIFLLAAPLHVNNSWQANDRAREQIKAEADQAEKQLDTRLNQEVGAQRAQINALLENPDQLNRALDSGQVPGEQAKLLRDFQRDPKALDAFLEKQAKEFRTKLQTEVRTRRVQAEKQAGVEAVKTGFRIGLSSLLLSVCYIIAGWTGLRNLAGVGGGRKAPR